MLTLLRMHQPDAAEQELHALQHMGAGDVADVPALQAAIDAERAVQDLKPYTAPGAKF